MKKRIISLVLVVVLVCAMCLSASAAQVTGQTTENKATRATLNLGTNSASASTWCETGGSSILGTYLEFTYTNTSNQRTFKIGAGNASAAVQPSDIKPAGAISAFSNHIVEGGAGIGNWRYSMTVNR